MREGTRGYPLIFYALAVTGTTGLPASFYEPAPAPRTLPYISPRANRPSKHSSRSNDVRAYVSRRPLSSPISDPTSLARRLKMPALSASATMTSMMMKRVPISFVFGGVGAERVSDHAINTTLREAQSTLELGVFSRRADPPVLPPRNVTAGPGVCCQTD